MQIINRVKELRTISVDEFLSLTFNELKDENRDVTKLKNAIIKSGFSFPVFLWQGHDYVIDGAGRKKAVKELKDEGYQFDGIPVVDIEAETLEEAKQKTLEVSSQFGVITEDNFLEFTKDINVDFETIELADIDSNISNNLDSVQNEKGMNIEPLIEVIISCETIEEQELIFNKITELGYKCRTSNL